MPQGQKKKKTHKKPRSDSVTNSTKILQMEKEKKITERLEQVLSLATFLGESELTHEITVEEECCLVMSDSF